MSFIVKYTGDKMNEYLIVSFCFLRMHDDVNMTLHNCLIFTAHTKHNHHLYSLYILEMSLLCSNSIFFFYNTKHLCNFDHMRMKQTASSARHILFILVRIVLTFVHPYICYVFEIWTFVCRQKMEDSVCL